MLPLLLLIATAVSAVPTASQRLPLLLGAFKNHTSLLDDAAALSRFHSVVGDLTPLVHHKKILEAVKSAKRRLLKTPAARPDVVAVGKDVLDKIASRLKGTVLDRPTLADINKPIAEYLVGGDVMPSLEDLIRTASSSDAPRISDNSRIKRGAPIVTSTRWNKYQPIGFIFNMESTRQLIRTATQKIAANTCLNFQENSNVGTQLQFHRGGGCWSYIGQQPVAVQPISIDNGCEIVPIISHEISHALGLDHTQNRKDRDAYVSVNIGAVDSTKQHNFEKRTDIQNNNFGVPYDYGSDMHYGALDFSNNGQAVLIASQGDYINTMGQRKSLTFYDYKMINLLYNCSANCPGSNLVCQNGGYPSPRQCNVCVCNDFFTGTTCQIPKNVLSISATVPGKTDYHTAYDGPLNTSGNNYNWDMFSKDAAKTITAPQGRRIRVTITRMYPAFGQLPCYLGCPFFGVEFVDNAAADLSTVGKIFCCTKDENFSFVSKTNVIGYKAFAAPGMPFDATVTYTVA